MPDVSRRRGGRWAVSVAALGLALTTAVGSSGTLARFSDADAVGGNVLSAGFWDTGPTPPEVPAACAHITFQHVFVLSDDGDVEWIAGQPVHIGGGSGAFHGTNENDLIINTGGRRTIHGKDGDDCLVAGPGGDQLHGGRGDDVLLGGEGMDKLHGHFGDNLLDGDEGRDVCSPGPGNDTLVNCDIPHGSSSSQSTEGGELEVQTSSTGEESEPSVSGIDPEAGGILDAEPTERTDDEPEEGADQ